MTPAAKKALDMAVVCATTFTPQINNALIRARHRSGNDQERLAQLEDARRAATDVLLLIQRAETALKVNRRVEAD